MPFIAPNRGKTSQPEKPPWVRDSSNQQSSDLPPWRRNPANNNVSKSSTPEKGGDLSSPPPGGGPSKPGTSKLQINLKSAKKPEAESPAAKGGKEPGVPIKKEVNIPIFREESPAPKAATTTTGNNSSSAGGGGKSKTVVEPKPPAQTNESTTKRPQYEPPKQAVNAAKKHYKILSSESPFLATNDPEPPAGVAAVAAEPSAKPVSKVGGKDLKSAPAAPAAGIEIKPIVIESKPITIGKDPKPSVTELKQGKEAGKSSSAEVKIIPIVKPTLNETKVPLKPATKTAVNDTKSEAGPPLVKEPKVGKKTKAAAAVVVEPKPPAPIEPKPHPGGEAKSPPVLTNSNNNNNNNNNNEIVSKTPFGEIRRKSVKQRDDRERSFSPKPSEEIVNFKRNLRPVPTVDKEKPSSSSPLLKQGSSEDKTETPAIKVNLKPVESRINKASNNPPPPPPSPSHQPTTTTTTTPDSTNSSNSSKKMPGAPPPPPPPPGPPPPPPPPGMPGLPPQRPQDPAKVAKIESLRKTPRRRPDWSDMMKQIETASARKLKHVECNDRSKPIIPRMKSRGKFVFDSEAKPATKTDAIHNRLLTEIQGGVKLKKVQCNDRSKPILTGLRKFLRQKTIEEPKEKGAAGEDVPAPAEEIPNIDIGLDIDDIDTLRDELQSVKQMLELEIQAKLLLAKENRDLKCQNITMEARNEDLQYQLEQQLALIPYDEGRRDSRALKDIKKSKSGLYKCPSGIRKSKSGFGGRGKDKDKSKEDVKEQEEDLGELNELEEEIATLRSQALAAKNTAEEWEAKFKEVSEKLLLAQGKNEDAEQRILVLEKKIEKLHTQKGGPPISSNDKWTQTEEQIQQQGRRVSRQMSTRKASGADGLGSTAEEGGGDDDYDSEDSDLEVDEATVIRKKQEREIKLWENKLRNVKEKQVASQLERKSLKAQQKKLEQELKEQKLKLKELQKEVDKMAKMLKGGNEDGGDDDDEDEEDEEEEEEESEEESEDEDDSEEESSSESEEEESSSEEDDPSAPHDDRLNLFNKRVKRWDNILNALRKGNYLLRANIDRLKDDLEDVRIKYHDLEHELNTVLSDV